MAWSFLCTLALVGFGAPSPAHQNNPTEQDAFDIRTPQGVRFALQAMEMAYTDVYDRLAAFSNRRIAVPRTIGKEIEQVKKQNTAKFKLIVATSGWPKISQIGEEPAHIAYWFASQADSDRRFQEKCLRLMQPHLATGDVSRQNYAYLFDQVACAEGRKQRYGTQLMKKGNKFFVRPVEDPKRLDSRRRAMGLIPIAEDIRAVERAVSGK